MIRSIPILLVGVILLGACDSTESPSGPTTAYGFPNIAAPPPLPDSVAQQYVEDAALLAFQITRGVEGDAASIVLPEPLRETLYNALGHVWHSSNLPARDSVIVQFDIHPFHLHSVHRLRVSVETEADWIQAWIDGEIMTGNAEVDQITQEWALTLEEPLDPNDPFPTAQLYSEEARNLLSLSSEFEGIEGVRYSNPRTYAGDGNTIDVAPRENAIELVYSRGFGDCPSGCIGRHYWRFSVAADGSVEFLESYGSPLP